MPKKPSRHLFDLIKSLSSQERKAFIGYANRHVIGLENKYFFLFKIIDKQKRYNEKSIQLKAATRIQSSHLAITKNQLYNHILACLRQYHFDKSGKIRFYQAVVNTHLLMEKGLLSQAQKSIDKARKLAETYQLQLSFLPLSLIERRMLRMKVSEKRERQKLLDLQAHCRDFLNQLANQFELLDWNEQEWIQEKAPRPVKQKQGSTLFEKMKWLKEKYYLKELKFSGKINYYFLKQTFYAKLRCYRESLTCWQKIIALMEREAPLLKSEYDYQARYIRFLLNYFNMTLFLGYLDQIPEIIKKVEKVEVENVRLEAEIFFIKHYILTNFHLAKQEYIKALSLDEAIEMGLTTYQELIAKDLILTLKYNLGVAFFGANQLSKAMDKIAVILKEDRSTIQKDIYLSARFLQLLLCIELGQYRFAENLIYSFRQIIRNYRSFKNMPKYKILPFLERIVKNEGKTISIEPLVAMSKVKGEEELKIWFYNYF